MGMTTTPSLPIIAFMYIWTIVYANNPRPLPNFHTILVFGDSTVDTGNNNYFKTIVKANFSPYGKTYPNHLPTGRFSNGKLIPDFLAFSLNIKQFVPPFLKPNLSDNELLTGVAFASAASGYDDSTNSRYQVIPLSKQLHLFRNYTARLNQIVGQEKTNKIINDALVIISAGTNDVFGKDDPKYHYFLLDRLQTTVKDLYDMGCRWMMIGGLPPVGCLPSHMISIKSLLGIKCVAEENAYAASYNKKLVRLLPRLQAKFTGTRIAYVDVYHQLMDMMTHPKKYGLKETKRGCCGTGYIEMAVLCNPITITCRNPSEFLFWDAVHPSQSAYFHISKYVVREVLPKLILGDGIRNRPSPFHKRTQ